MILVFKVNQSVLNSFFFIFFYEVIIFVKDNIFFVVILCLSLDGMYDNGLIVKRMVNDMELQVEWNIIEVE